MDILVKHVYVIDDFPDMNDVQYKNQHKMIQN